MRQRSRSMVLHICSASLALVMVGPVSADWVDFVDETGSRLVVTSDSPFVTGNPDPLAETSNDEQDMWCDYFGPNHTLFGCVLVAKQLGTNSGKRRNWLFMLENGQLVDRTDEYASTSDIESQCGNCGDSGFYTPTADRDVAIADLNGDGWSDVVTAVTLSGSGGGPGDKWMSHPRIYINQGADGGGNWLGLIYDDVDRVPTMPAEPRFCSVSPGDVDGDGDIDLYLGDYQQGGSRLQDLNDRLWINDGSGYFTDESTVRMSFEMLESSFAMATVIADVNGDGRMDILKDDALNFPQAVSVSYNNLGGGGTDGVFNTYQLATPNIDPYHINTGDANGDGLLDIVVTRDAQDSVLINGGNDGIGQAIWTDIIILDSEGAFGGNNKFMDLDKDGFEDVFITSMDVDLVNPGTRGFLYHTGQCAGVGCLPTFQNEGDCGISTAHYQGSNDVWNFDINGDDWDDLFLCSTSGGCAVYINQPPFGFVFSYPQGTPGMIAPGTPSKIEVQVAPVGGAAPDPAGGVMQLSINGGDTTSVPMTWLGNNTYSVDLPAGTCTDAYTYSFVVEAIGGVEIEDSTERFTLVALGTETTLSESFEADVSAWTVASESVTSGEWEVANPVQTISGSSVAQPGADAEPGANTMAFVTQNCPSTGACGGHTAGSSDLDGGPTDLISPVIDLAGADGVVTYSKWFFCSDASNAEADVMVVAVSNDDGANWVDVETVTGTDSQWVTTSFIVGSFVEPTSEVRVRFRVADQPNDSVTNAGIDAFIVDRLVCDACGSGCDDGNPCTFDECIAELGCQYTNAAGSCDDGDACTTGDSCSAGVCVGGGSLTCDDGNACTDDSCDSGSGCVFANNNASCDDGDACTTGDVCGGGSCSGSAVDCSGAGTACAMASCDPAGGSGNCDIVTPLADGTGCDDGDPCNVGETCQSGACSGGAAPDCSGAGDQCNTAGCSSSGAEGNCDALFAVANGTPCDDGDACNLNEACQAGACTGGDPADCSAMDDECNVASCAAGGADGNCDVLEPANEGLPCNGGEGTCVSGGCVDIRSCTTHGDCADLDLNGIRDDNCIWWACSAGVCAGTDIGFADMGGQFGECAPDGTADGNDRFHALNCFADDDPNDSEPPEEYPCEVSPPTAYNVDAGGQFGSCEPDGVCDGNDAFAALNAFGGSSPCTCAGGPAPILAPTVVDWSTIRLESSIVDARPGQLVTIDVYMEEGLADLRGYQLHLHVSGGARGGLELIDIAVRDGKVAHVFDGLAFWDAYNLKTGQMVVGLDGDGVNTAVDGYLATYTYRVGKQAAGTFMIELLHDDEDVAQRTFVFPTLATGKIDITDASAAVITVGSTKVRRSR